MKNLSCTLVFYSPQVQPGMEMMPMNGFGVGPGAGGGSALASLTGTKNMQELQESLKGAPADVLAAAERLSLIPSNADVGSSVVRTAPGSEDTDTGMLSVSNLETSV